MFMCPRSTDPPDALGPLDPLRPFTPIQERIAEMLADGQSAPVIASVLRCSYHTVCGHIRTMTLVLPGTEPAQEKIRAFVLARRRRAS